MKSSIAAVCVLDNVVQPGYSDVRTAGCFAVNSLPSVALRPPHVSRQSAFNPVKINQQMFDQFRTGFPLDDDKWNDYTSCFKRIKVPAKTILLREGDVSKKAFLIQKGCIRVWFNNNGKDVTFQFFFENSTIASVESFKTGCPSLVTIETIEPSVLWYIHKKDADRIAAEISEITALRNVFIDAVFQRTFDYMKHFLSFLKDTPTQRYLNLITEKPQLLQRVPQHYIASYLGISTVHLSRVKRALAKQGRRGI